MALPVAFRIRSRLSIRGSAAEVHLATGRLEATVAACRPARHPKTCEPRGAGFDALCGVWRDPDFDASRRAVYYARVLENPSCRYTTQLCLLTPPAEQPPICSDARIPKQIQERAWTSPIWYTPAAAS